MTILSAQVLKPEAWIHPHFLPTLPQPTPLAVQPVVLQTHPEPPHVFMVCIPRRTTATKWAGGGSHHTEVKQVKVLVTQSYLTLCDPTDWAARLLCPWDSPGKNSAVGSHSLLQGSFPPRDQTQVSHIADRFFTIWATREAPCYTKLLSKEALSFTHPPAHMREPPSPPSCFVFPCVSKFAFLLLQVVSNITYNFFLHINLHFNKAIASLLLRAFGR